ALDLRGDAPCAGGLRSARRDHRHRLDLEQCAVARQLADLYRGRSGRRLGVDVAIPYLEEDRQVRHIGKVVGDLDDVLEAAADGLQADFQILKALRRLRPEVTGLAGEFAVRCHAELPGEIHGARGTCRLHHVSIAAGRWDRRRIDEFVGHRRPPSRCSLFRIWRQRQPYTLRLVWVLGTQRWEPRGLVAMWTCVLIAAAFTLAVGPAEAAPALDGARMGWPWALPFAGILLSIATGPLLFPKLWHAHYGKIAAGWAVLALAPIALLHGAPVMTAALVHAILAEYLSFIILLFSLYVVAGGILVTGTLRGTPATNTGILAFGTLIASLVGTTGAAMILIRPLIRANAARRSMTHVVIFFIILVCNVGGALSPLGDPPLFVGFLRGIDFFWTTRHLALQTLIVAGALLIAFVLLDVWRARRDPAPPVTSPCVPIRVRGAINLVLIALIVAVILLSAAWKTDIAIDAYGTKVALESLLRDAVLLFIAALSLWLTPD